MINEKFKMKLLQPLLKDKKNIISNKDNMKIQYGCAYMDLKVIDNKILNIDLILSIDNTNINPIITIDVKYTYNDNSTIDEILLLVIKDDFIKSRKTLKDLSDDISLSLTNQLSIEKDLIDVIDDFEDEAKSLFLQEKYISSYTSNGLEQRVIMDLDDKDGDLILDNSWEQIYILETNVFYRMTEFLKKL